MGIAWFLTHDFITMRYVFKPDFINLYGTVFYEKRSLNIILTKVFPIYRQLTSLHVSSRPKIPLEITP
jgi:hypothetical protein